MTCSFWQKNQFVIDIFKNQVKCKLKMKDLDKSKIILEISIHKTLKKENL